MDERGDMSAMDHTKLSCDQFDELLPDYLEGMLGARDAAAVEGHAAACERCAALLADLNGIRTAAAALPELAPPRDLWDGISARIAAPVIPLESAGSGRHSIRRPYPRVWSPAWLGAAAAALVAVTAGVTYELTVRANGKPAPVVAAKSGVPPAGVGAAPQGGQGGQGGTAGRTDAVQGTPSPGQVQAVASAVPGSGGPSGSQGGALATAGAARTPLRAAARQPVTEAEATYNREVDALARILGERRATLNPATVGVLERNLQIIDRAIRESRGALAKDPASEFLNRQLNNALEKKLDLLRTAALLPTT